MLSLRLPLLHSQLLDSSDHTQSSCSNPALLLSMLPSQSGRSDQISQNFWDSLKLCLLIYKDSKCFFSSVFNMMCSCALLESDWRAPSTQRWEFDQCSSLLLAAYSDTQALEGACLSGEHLNQANLNGVEASLAYSVNSSGTRDPVLYPQPKMSKTKPNLWKYSGNICTVVLQQG